MMEIIRYLKARYLSEKAQGIVEYALLLAFIVGIAIYITSGDNNLQDAVSGKFQETTNTLNNAANNAGGNAGE